MNNLKKENHTYRIPSLIGFVLIGLLCAVVSAHADDHESPGKKHPHSAQKTDSSHDESHEHEGEEDHGHQHKSGEKDAHKDEGHKEHDDEHSHGHGHGEHGEEEGSSRTGPGLAITAASKKTGIQLSPKAIQRLGVKSSSLQKGGQMRVPVSSLVYFQAEVGVYRLRDGWYKLVEVKVSQKGSKDAVIQTSELRESDSIVTEGVSLLRVAEMEAWGGSGDGHGH